MNPPDYSRTTYRLRHSAAGSQSKPCPICTGDRAASRESVSPSTANWCAWSLQATDWVWTRDWRACLLSSLLTTGQGDCWWRVRSLAARFRIWIRPGRLCSRVRWASGRREGTWRRTNWTRGFVWSWAWLDSGAGTAWMWLSWRRFGRRCRVGKGRRVPGDCISYDWRRLYICLGCCRSLQSRSLVNAKGKRG